MPRSRNFFKFSPLVKPLCTPKIFLPTLLIFAFCSCYQNRMTTKALINFLRATEHSQSLPLTGDPERDRQLLAASADRKLRAYEAAFGSSQRDPSTEEEFTDPPLYRDFLRLDDGTLLELTRHPDLDGRIRFIQWDPSPISDSQASATEDHPAAPEPQSESRLGQIAYVDRLAVIHGGEN